MTMPCSWALPSCILYISQWFYLFREEVEKMAGKDALVHLHLLQSGIIVCRDNQVDAILEILVDDLDGPSLAIKQHIKGVRPSLFGVQANTIPCSHLPTSNRYRFWCLVIVAL